MSSLSINSPNGRDRRNNDYGATRDTPETAIASVAGSLSGVTEGGYEGPESQSQARIIVVEEPVDEMAAMADSSTALAEQSQEYLWRMSAWKHELDDWQREIELREAAVQQLAQQDLDDWARSLDEYEQVLDELERGLGECLGAYNGMALVSSPGHHSDDDSDEFYDEDADGTKSAAAAATIADIPGVRWTQSMILASDKNPEGQHSTTRDRNATSGIAGSRFRECSCIFEGNASCPRGCQARVPVREQRKGSPSPQGGVFSRLRKAWCRKERPDVQ